MTTKTTALIVLCVLVISAGGYYLLPQGSSVSDVPADVAKVATGTNYDIDPVFLSIIDKLKTKTALPIRLPKKLPESLGVGKGKIYAILGDSGPGHYSVSFTTETNCHVTECSLTSLSAVSGVDQVTIEYAANVKIAKLAHDITGMHHPPSCVNVCTGGWMDWSQGGVSYSAGIKAGSESELIPLVNSIVDAEPIYTDDLTKWNRYKNDEHGISFHYPYNWTLTEKGDDGVILDNLDFKSTMPRERCGGAGTRCLDSLEGSLIKISFNDPNAIYDKYCPKARETTLGGYKATECGPELGSYVIGTESVEISFMHAKTRADLTSSERAFLDSVVLE